MIDTDFVATAGLHKDALVHRKPVRPNRGHNPSRTRNPQ